MLEPKFKFDRRQRLYITPNWIATPHWLVNRTALRSKPYPKAVRGLDQYRDGEYPMGIHGGWQTSEVKPNLPKLIPKSKKGFTRVERDPIRVTLSKEADKQNIVAYVFKTEKGEEILVNPDYVELMKLGDAWFGKNTIWIEQADITLAILMPMRK